MKINYDSETDSLYIDFSDTPSVESEEVREGVVLDFDKDGNITGVDIQHASKKLDLSFMEMNAVPIGKTRLAS